MNTKHKEKTGSITVRQTYPVPPGAVFRAWSDPELFRQWWGHGAWAATEILIELKPQGAFRYILHNQDESKTFTSVGNFKEVINDKKLVFSWEWLEGQHQGRQTLVTVELNDLGGSTELVLTHSRHDSEELMEDHRAGWTACLQRIAGVLE
ncbi:MAG: SRPBCC domain-containing protein [candidate division Zixibacteria bacterium]|nr:SRPBCC domain-containing protein [candidate division Zixibacteria bacterium]